MTQARRPRGEARRARLLQAAAQVFAEHGYHETKVSTIVANAGVTQPTFYFYFASKEALFTELVAAFRTHFRSLIEQGRLDANVAPEDAVVVIRQNIAAIFKFLAADPDMTRISLLQAPDAESIKQDLVQVFAAKLAVNQSAGHLRAEIAVEIVAEAIAGMVERLTVRYLLTRERDPEILADIVADFVLTGILRRNI